MGWARTGVTPSLVPLTLSLCSISHHPASTCMDRSLLLPAKMLQLLPGAAQIHLLQAAGWASPSQTESVLGAPSTMPGPLHSLSCAAHSTCVS